MTDEKPVVEISTADETHYIVDECPICGETHRHGSVPELEVGETTTRGTHCRTENAPGEYELKFTEGTSDER
jgi:hypothetical protein